MGAEPTERSQNGMTKPVTTTETINPAKARKYLDTMDKNRRVRKRVVERYALAMKADQWSLTGEPIIFSTKGVLLDGQHRLHACIEAGVSFRSDVRRGVNAETFADINTGASRTPGDALYIAGFAKTKLCAAAIKVIHNLELMEEDDKLRNVRGRDITRQDLLRFMEDHEEELSECARVCDGEGKALLRPPSVFVALRFRFGQSNAMRAQQFFDQLVTGADLSSDNPINKLRNYLIRELSQKNLRRSLEWKVAVTIKCWNAWLRGDSVRQLKFSDDENWPRIYERMQPRRRSKRKAS
jgi:hypothetical protein